MVRLILSDLEEPEQADAAQHGDAGEGHDVHAHQDQLQDAYRHHEAVEAVEERHEVGGQA